MNITENMSYSILHLGNEMEGSIDRVWLFCLESLWRINFEQGNFYGQQN